LLITLRTPFCFPQNAHPRSRSGGGRAGKHAERCAAEKSLLGSDFTTVLRKSEVSGAAPRGGLTLPMGPYFAPTRIVVGAAEWQLAAAARVPRLPASRGGVWMAVESERGWPTGPLQRSRGDRAQGPRGLAKGRSAVWLAPRPRPPVKRVVKRVAREWVVGTASPTPTLKCRHRLLRTFSHRRPFSDDIGTRQDLVIGWGFRWT